MPDSLLFVQKLEASADVGSLLVEKWERYRHAGIAQQLRTL